MLHNIREQMKTIHIEVVIEDCVDVQALLNTVNQEADNINGTVISCFELSSTKQEIERANEIKAL